MTEDPNQGLVRHGMAATTGAGPGRQRRPRPAPAARPATASVPQEAISYHPNDALAQTIVRAWSDDGFRRRLLTFPDNNMQAPNYESTRAALGEMGMTIETKTPVVLTEAQYSGFTKAADQILFVLPNALGSVYSFSNAQLAMSVTMLGM